MVGAVPRYLSSGIVDLPQATPIAIPGVGSREPPTLFSTNGHGNWAPLHALVVPFTSRDPRTGRIHLCVSWVIYISCQSIWSRRGVRTRRLCRAAPLAFHEAIGTFACRPIRTSSCTCNAAGEIQGGREVPWRAHTLARPPSALEWVRIVRTPVLWVD